MLNKRLLLILVAIVAVVASACQNNDGKGQECYADNDCAKAGCSGQLCVPAEKAAGIITTCEFREEWDCLKLTSCGCMEGKCAWVQNDEYKTCMKKFS